MKKVIFFPLWRIEKLESYLENMEQQGYRLDNIKYSYCFFFKQSIPIQMQYFLSYKSFRGQSMGCCDYALTSRYGANNIKSKLSFYTMYRTKEQKDRLSLLYEVRLDYIRVKLLEYALTSMFCALIFIVTLTAQLIQSSYNGLWFLCIVVAICVCMTVYYFYGYCKQRKKCKNYSQSNDSSKVNTENSEPKKDSSR